MGGYSTYVRVNIRRKPYPYIEVVSQDGEVLFDLPLDKEYAEPTSTTKQRGYHHAEKSETDSPT